MVNGCIALFAGLLLIATSSGASLKPESRIIGGEDADIGQFPYTVSLRVDSAHVGGGVIINEWYILAPAHSIADSGNIAISSNRVSVRVGSTNQYAGGKIVDISEIHIHPSYGNFLHDLAVLKVSERLVFTDKITAIELSTDANVAAGTPVTVSGWGTTDETGEPPYKLQYGQLTVVSEADCEYEAGYGYSSVLCLRHEPGHGICHGDEGAAVVVDKKLVGTVMFAFGNCGTKYPDVSTRVSYYNDWIKSIINP